MESKCIICKEQKHIDFFNEEHVFPAAIGGALIIKNVCENCNSNLGKDIDNPFLKNEAILFYRNHFNLTRDESNRLNNIPNPFKGTFKDSKGVSHIAKFKDGKLIAQSLQNFEWKITDEFKDGIGKLTLPKENEEDTISLIQKYLKRKGIQASDIVIANKEETNGENITVNLNVSFKSIILECVKISYEILSTLFPSYLNDSASIQAVNFLKSKTPNEEFKTELDKCSVELTEYFKTACRNAGIPASQHCIIIQFVEGYGLICAVKLFELMYPVFASKDFNPLPEKKIIFFTNDAKNRTLSSNIKIELHGETFALDLPEDLRNKAEMEGVPKFSNIDGKIPIYNMHNKIAYQSVQDLILPFFTGKNLHLDMETVEFKIDLSDRELFVRTVSGERIKLLYVKTKKNIELL